MALEKPQQFLPQMTGDAAQDAAQDALAQVTQVQRSQGIQKRIVDAPAKDMAPGTGIVLRPNQTVDVPHGMAKKIQSVSVASTINPLGNARSAPNAAPNLQVIEMPGDVSKRVVRVRYIPPKDDNGDDIETPAIRAKLELG